jgi:hypothetical protein
VTHNKAFRVLLLTETQIDRFVLHNRTEFACGVTLIATALALPRGWGIGFFTGFMLASLGIYCFVFRNWRTEPGLWMLASFLTVALAPCWAYFEYLHWQHVFAPPVAKNQIWNVFRLSIDAFISLLVFGKTVRLSTSVAFQNWTRTRNSTPAPTGK